jgi:nucleoside-diphosphate-sugar epimerase
MNIVITGGNGNIAKIIMKHLKNKYNIFNPSRNELNLLDRDMVNNYFNSNNFDILIHTAITGGRRTKDESYDVVYNNLLMFENILLHAHKFKLIINLDSGAIYDRSTNIMNRKETEIFTVPKDFYGFSKYIIYNRTLLYDNIINFRIFNIFHEFEENDRFIKRCYNAKLNDSVIDIYEDKYFDFFSEDNFIIVLEHYINNFIFLPKTINLSYDIKYKLSDIANIIGCKYNIFKNSDNNYCGDGYLLASLNLPIKINF